MRVCICNQKGGVGKTTTAINLSACLALKGKKVLLIDLDPQAAATSGLGINVHRGELTIYDVLAGEEISGVVREADIENLFIAPASTDLAGVEVELANEVGREFLLRGAVENATGEGEGYDYVIADTPPSLGVLTLNGITACENILVPVQAEYYALEGLAQLLRTTDLVKRRLNVPVRKRFLVTMLDRRTRLSKDVLKEVRRMDDAVFRAVIPRNVKLAEVPSYGLPITLYAPNSAGAKAYERLAKEVMSVEKW